MEPYDVIVNQPVVIDNVSCDLFFILNFAEYIFAPHESSPPNVIFTH